MQNRFSLVRWLARSFCFASCLCIDFRWRDLCDTWFLVFECFLGSDGSVSFSLSFGKFDTWLLLCVHTSESQSNDIRMIFLLSSSCRYCSLALEQFTFTEKERFWLLRSLDADYEWKLHNCWFIQFAAYNRLKKHLTLEAPMKNQITTITIQTHKCEGFFFLFRFLLVYSSWLLFFSLVFVSRLAVTETIRTFRCICTCIGLPLLVVSPFNFCHNFFFFCYFHQTELAHQIFCIL